MLAELIKNQENIWLRLAKIKFGDGYYIYYKNSERC